jgi:hypothetical protein
VINDEWLRAQLDEDERAAKAASMLSKPPWGPRITCDPDDYVSGRIVDDRGYTVVHVEDQTPGPAEADHIARWDPARVLRKVAADRLILDLHFPDTTRYVEPQCHECSGCGCCSVDWPCDTVKLVALPYAAQPEYGEAWLVVPRDLE